jgi:hypothetical protein
MNKSFFTINLRSVNQILGVAILAAGVVATSSVDAKPVAPGAPSSAKVASPVGNGPTATPNGDRLPPPSNLCRVDAMPGAVFEVESGAGKITYMSSDGRYHTVELVSTTSEEVPNPHFPESPHTTYTFLFLVGDLDRNCNPVNAREVRDGWGFQLPGLLRVNNSDPWPVQKFYLTSPVTRQR